MRQLMMVVFCFWAVGAAAQYKNIKLAEEADNYPPRNPSITINHKDIKNIVAGISLNRAVYTNDGGATWQQSILKSAFGGGNPAIISDQKGQVYYFHQADPGAQGSSQGEGWLDRIVCQTSEDGGKTWQEETSFGNNPPKDQERYWPTVHPKKSILYTVWTQYDHYKSAEVSCQSNILFSMSTNGGSKWTKSVQLSQTPGDCSDSGSTVADAITAVNIEGKIYATWSNNGIIFFDRSYDGGETWLSNDIAISKMAGGWSMKIPGVGKSNSRPMLVVNNSPTRAMGTLYITYADQKNGSNDTDIWFLRSVNKGDNWTSPIRINKDEPGKHQFSPVIAVDQITGFIYVAYYDQRDADLQTDVYLAYSLDGGNVFYETKISETPFITTEENPIGEYINIAAAGGIITPIWTRSDNGKLSVWTTVIKGSDLPRK
ncbi:hypothetical protein BH10BAC4_BH10BAC4_08490 [soil metagenome]